MKSIKIPDAQYIVERLTKGEVVGVVTDRQVPEGTFELIDSDQGYGSVRLRKGVKFKSGRQAIDALGEKLPPSVGEQIKDHGESWFCPLAKGELRSDPVGIQKKRVTGIFGSSAGKTLIAERLARIFPVHKTYVEPFVGGGAVLFAKEPSTKEVINDLDPEVASTWKFLTNITDAQVNELKGKKWVGEKKHFQRLQKTLLDGQKLDPLNRAYRFLYLSRFAFNRLIRRGTLSNANVGSKSNTLLRIDRHRDRIKNIIARNDDYEKIIKEFDSSDTFFFLDPPYAGYNAVEEGAGAGHKKWDEKRFVDVLTTIKGKFLVTYGVRGDTSLFKRWNIQRWRHMSGVGNAGGSGGGPRMGTTIIITNYTPTKKSDLAPVAPSGNVKGREITLDEIVSAFKTAVLRKPAVALVGGLANNGSTTGDIDLLLRGPIDEQTAHVIKFRLGRMLASVDPELADRIQFLDDDMGGPFTSHVDLFDLVLQAREEPEVVQMAVKKQADPLMRLPKQRGPKPSVYQLHFRGASVHGDWRIKINNELVGWTNIVQKAGAVPDVDDVSTARRLAQGLDLSGNRIHKPLKDGRVLATPKTVHPVEWLRIDAKVFPEGEPGASPEEEGVILAVDRPNVEFGRQEAFFHEYFLTKGKWFNGIMMYRQLVGTGKAHIYPSPAGKVRMASKLVAMLPEHTTYVEPFCGSAAVFFTKESVKTEVLNDINKDIVDALRTMKRLTKDQIDVLKKKNWTGDKARYDRLLKSKPTSDLEKLRRFLYVARFSYGSLGSSFSPSQTGRRSQIAELLERNYQRLSKCRLCSEDYQNIISTYDGEETLFFLDPPYVGHDVNVGEKDFDDQKFFDALKNIKGKFLLTCGTRGDLPSLIKKTNWDVQRISPRKSLSNMRGVKQSSLDQLIVANYKIKKQTPEGELFWTGTMRKDFLPSILTTRAVRRGEMPPDGYSWIPTTLEKVTPRDLQYWRFKGAEAKTKRDELVKSKYFTPENIKMVNGEFRRVVTKMFLVEKALDYSIPTEIKKQEQTKPFVILRQTFKGPTVVREAPTQTIWWVAWRDGAGVNAFQVESDISTGKGPFTAQFRRFTDDKILSFEGPVEPGQKVGGIVLNPSKDTPSEIFLIDSGKLAVIDEEPGHYRLSVGGKEVKGTIEFRQEEKGAPIWEVVRKAIWGMTAGKSRIADRLVKMFPTHKTYVEPFVGTGAILFEKEASDVEVVNDLNDDTAHAFKTIKSISSDQLEKLEAMNWTGDKATFDRLKNSNPDDPLKRLHRMLYIARFSFGSGRRVFSPSDQGATAHTYKKVGKFAPRLKDVKVYSGDYEKVVNKYDGPNTFFFLDPPYPGYDAEIKEKEFDEERFFNVLKSIKGKFLLTYGKKGKLPGMISKSSFMVQQLTSRRSLRHQGPLKQIIVTNYKIQKAEVPTKEGVQVWNPKQKDPNVDRDQMKPPAIFQPMKPSDQNSFTKMDDLVNDFVTDEAIKNGVVVEPKWNGRVIVVQYDGQNPLIYFEDSLRDRAKYFPTLSKEIAEFKEPIILVGELIDYDEDGNALPRRELARFGQDKVHDDSRAKVHTWDVLYWDGNHLSKPLTERRGILKKALGDRGKGPFIPTPNRLVQSRENLKQAFIWAGKMQSSEGAMVKLADSTYTLGGQTSSIAKLKTIRVINAIVHDKTLKKPSPQQEAKPKTWIYHAAVGPLTESEKEEFTDTVEIAGKTYAEIGSTFATNIDAKQGDVLRVEATELLFVDRPKAKRITWFTPMVQERVHVRPHIISQIRSLLFNTEVEKRARITIVKTNEEERYVLGVVLEPNDGDDGAPLKPDAHKDIYSADEIKNTAHKYLIEYGDLGVMHQREAAKSEMAVVESYLAPTDMTINNQKIRKGTWLIGAKIFADKLWSAVKRGELNAWSIDGEALRRPEDDQE